MNKSYLIPLVATAMLATAGCLNNFTGAYPVVMGELKTTTYLDGDTNRIASVTTAPVYGYQWHNDLMRLAYDTHADSVKASYGDASFEMNGYNSSSTNAPAIISASGTAVGTIVGAAVSAAAKSLPSPGVAIDSSSIGS